MQEIELKFQVPRARRAAVAASLAGVPAQHLQAAYFDTEDRALARSGVALRLRREGRQWVQTVKALGDGGLTRLEHNVPRAGSAAAVPMPDLALHADTPAGARLVAALAGRPASALACQYRTDIRRRIRTLRPRGALLELAFDEGAIVAGPQRLPVCELEIELLRGAAPALLDAAQRHAERHRLWLDMRSKAERGDLLARGETVAPERKARAVQLAASMSVAQARRAVISACFDQIGANASQVASGEFRDEHVHQLRVGLRRLRTALRLFALDAPDAEPDALAAGAAGLFGELGAARDRVAVGGPLRRDLQRALAAAGLDLVPPELPQAASGDDPADCVRAPAAQAFLLDLLRAIHAGEPPVEAEAAALRAWLCKRLNRWHRQVAKTAPLFATLADADRHRLRKRVKRLRYAVEFVAALFGPRKVERYLEPLRALQDRLGALNDAAVALAAFRGASPSDAAVVFALGWLAARRESLAASCEPALAAFAKAKRFWND